MRGCRLLKPCHSNDLLRCRKPWLQRQLLPLVVNKNTGLCCSRCWHTPALQAWLPCGLPESAKSMLRRGGPRSWPNTTSSYALVYLGPDSFLALKGGCTAGLHPFVGLLAGGLPLHHCCLIGLLVTVIPCCDICMRETPILSAKQHQETCVVQQEVL